MLRRQQTDADYEQTIRQHHAKLSAKETENVGSNALTENKDER